MGVGRQGRQGAAGTKYTPRKKIPQGSARGQCPVVLYERKGGREQQDGGRAEKRSGQKATGRNRRRRPDRSERGRQKVGSRIKLDEIAKKNTIRVVI